jgi:hypothetical protein
MPGRVDLERRNIRLFCLLSHINLNETSPYLLKHGNSPGVVLADKLFNKNIIEAPKRDTPVLI